MLPDALVENKGESPKKTFDRPTGCRTPLTRLWGRACLSKAGTARSRAVLYMAAIVAVRYNPHVKLL